MVGFHCSSNRVIGRIFRKGGPMLPNFPGCFIIRNYHFFHNKRQGGHMHLGNPPS